MRDRIATPRAVLVVRGALALTAVLAVAAVVRAVPGLLTRIPLFDVASVEVQGARWVTDREILEAAAVPDTANVWDDPSAWEAAAAAHPMVKRARIRRRLPATLVVEVEEREPVAFVATPLLEPVDAEGRILPLDPTRVRLDLPLVRLRAGSEGDDPPPVHRLREPVEAVVRLGRNPAFHGRLAELREEADGTVTALWGSSPALEIRMRLPVDPVRVEDGLEVLEMELARDSARTPLYVDLRWDEQVVVGYGTE